MFGELEHAFLLKMARSCRQLGLSQTESCDEICSRTNGFCAPHRIRQAVRTAFHPEDCPDLA